MKKLFCFLVVVFTIGKISFSQGVEFKYAKYIDGFWDKWEDSHLYVIRGNIDDFVIYYHYDHPSEYIMRIKIYYYSEEKKLKKLRLKNGWYEYDGIVEYFTYEYSANYTHFNIKEWPHSCVKIKNNLHWNDKYITKNTRQAKIMIQAKGAKCYNIFFDNIGLGIDIK